MGTQVNRTPNYRPDIEGLRGLAVALVVAFHASPRRMSGGFIGVDVFFVISGYLITGLLLREIEETGRLSFAGFYARRARRLLPASALVFLATLLACSLFLSPLQQYKLGDSGTYAVSYTHLDVYKRQLLGLPCDQLVLLLFVLLISLRIPGVDRRWTRDGGKIVRMDHRA